MRALMVSSDVASDDMPAAFDEEAVHDLASRMADTAITDLLDWFVGPGFVSRVARVDRTLLALGTPEPDLDLDGSPVAGSILRKLLHWTQVDEIVERLTSELA